MFKIKFILFINIVYLFNMFTLVLLINKNNNFYYHNYENVLNKFLFFFKNKNNFLILLLIIFFSGLPPFLFFFIKLTIFYKIKKFSYVYLLIFYIINTISVYLYIQFYKYISNKSIKKNFFFKKIDTHFYDIYFFIIYLNFCGFFSYQFNYHNLV